MRNTEHIRSLANHAARTAVAADRAVDAVLAATPAQQRAADLAAYHALNLAADAQRELRRAMAGELISAGAET